ncbi:SIR2 family protein [Novosphingobium sp.]|uniref:SIR2 family protein n=1 Tax=Novosphingobium sp. TaxID=1874826 RepID=UPI002FE23BCB
MIRDFKATIFCREMNMSKREIDTADAVWIERIDSFFRQSSILPPDGDPLEYAKSFEAVHPQARHRRQYIDDAISKGTPCFGQKVLGSLIAAGKSDCIFTTNFDPLIEEAAGLANTRLAVSDQNRPTVAAIDSAERALRCLNESDWPLVAKLHGDYQSVAIKNTGSELEEQDARMRHVLVEAAQRFGMIFVGYSGRDESIMQALGDVLEKPSPFPNGLYWVTSSADKLLPAVKIFLEKASFAGVDVAVVECATFDELAAILLNTTEIPKPLQEWVMDGRQASRLVPVQMPKVDARAFPVLRYSSLLVESLPVAARRLKLSQPSTTSVVREMLKQEKVRANAACLGSEVAIFGNDREILDALAPLGARLDGEIPLDPVADSWATGLLYDALVAAFTRRLPLFPRYTRSGHSILVAPPRTHDTPERGRRDSEILGNLKRAYGGPLTGVVPKHGYQFQEGIFLKLDHVDGRWWCGFEPFTFVRIPREAGASNAVDRPTDESNNDSIGKRHDRGGDPVGDWRRERWARRYNKSWAAIIDAWAELLTGRGADGIRLACGLEGLTGIDAKFAVSTFTGWSRPGHHHPYFDRTA